MKCRILYVHRPIIDTMLTDDNEFRQTLNLGGQLAPLVNSYIYLGLELTTILDKRSLALYLVKLRRKKVGPVLPFVTGQESKSVQERRVTKNADSGLNTKPTHR